MNKLGMEKVEGFDEFKEYLESKRNYINRCIEILNKDLIKFKKFNNSIEFNNIQNCSETVELLEKIDIYINNINNYTKDIDLEMFHLSEILNVFSDIKFEDMDQYERIIKIRTILNDEKKC